MKNLRSSKKKALRVAAVVADVEQAMWMEFFSWWKILEPFERFSVWSAENIIKDASIKR